jgi:3-deoxy-D-manno-octulosonate 8-phosphate phosphatase (KDO 8-P phosphatase)
MTVKRPSARNTESDELRRAKKVRLLLLDVDGVLTRGEISYDRRGREIKTFDVSDGTGVWLAQAMGLRVGLLTGRTSKAVEYRARELEVTLVRQGSRDKRADGLAIARELRLRPEQVAFVGDEVIDIPLLKAVGFAAAVANARPEVKDVAHYVALRRGGDGAVREIIEYLLKSQNKWNQALAPFLNPPA